MNNIKLAIFDLDGTALDTLSDLTDSINFVLKQNGFPERTEKEVRSFVGNGVKNLIKRSMSHFEEDGIYVKVLNEYMAYYELHSTDKTKPYEGITEVLTQLRENGIKTALISNKSDSTVQQLALKYFEGMFDYVAGEKENIPRKPAPDSVNLCLKTLGIDRQNAVYIGDSEVDIRTAENSGLTCIAVSWGFRDRDFLRENGAKIITDSPVDLFSVIKN